MLCRKIFINNNKFIKGIILSPSSHKLQFTPVTANAFSSVKAKSYYEILEINKNFTSQQLKAKFLKKARQLHPDHNESPQAQEQFKSIKQAYETLKDPQKKYMYDTGISVEPGQQSSIHEQYTNQGGKKYYENRWYHYQKPNFNDQRDDFYEQKKEMFRNEETPVYKQRLYMLFFVIVGMFGYDIILKPVFYKQAKAKMNKQLLEQSISDNKKAKIMKSYIDNRSRQHFVE